jgi:hypothetical protein
MAKLTAYDADTSSFGGTDGAWITFSVDVKKGTTVSFDWAFLAMDYYPFRDFAFLVAWSPAGKIEYFEKLAEIVPIPPSLFLLGSGLIGLAGLGRMRLFLRK